jgi:formylglycine-generating enzyme required for sulfatase activity
MHFSERRQRTPALIDEYRSRVKRIAPHKARQSGGEIIEHNIMLKTWTSCLLLGIATLFAATDPVLAQTPPSLGLRLFAGVNISGAVGSNYVIQFTSDVTQTNSWTSLAFLRLPATNFLFVDTTVPATGKRFYRALLQTPPTNMVFIPPNTFSLGTPTNEINRFADEGPQVTVTISHGFWMGKYEVTQREYQAVIGSNPSGFPGDLNRPVESVSWLDATNYCARLTQQELAAGHIRPGTHFRLPTEAEWEYAARAGTSTRFSYGDDPNFSNLANNAWYSANSGIMTHPVGQKAANPWALYDMEGNVLEWCQDWYGPYPGGFATDPQGPASNVTGVKVIRGGAWDAFEADCRSGRRLTEGVHPFIHDFILGFRVVLVTDAS